MMPTASHFGNVPSGGPRTISWEWIIQAAVTAPALKICAWFKTSNNPSLVDNVVTGTSSAMYTADARLTTPSHRSFFQPCARDSRKLIAPKRRQTAEATHAVVAGRFMA